MTPIDVFRARFPHLRDKTDEYVGAVLEIVCELGDAPPDAAPLARWLVDADGNVGLLEHAPVRSAWRTGWALATARMPQWRGVA